MVGCLPVAAQTERLVKARTLCFERVADSPDIHVLGEKDAYQILMPVEAFSNSFPCTLLDGEAVFYKKEGLDAGGEPKKVVVARARVADELKEVLFYFVPSGKKNGLLYDVRVLNDDLKSFPLGSSRVLNMSGTEVAFQLGEHVRKISPGKYAQVGDVTKRTELNMAPVVFKMLSNQGHWRTVAETKVRFTLRTRLFIVSYVHAETRQPLLKVYKDMPPRKEPVRTDP